MTADTLAPYLLVDDGDEAQSGLGKGLAAILSDTAGERPRRGGLASLIPESTVRAEAAPVPARPNGASLRPDDLPGDLVRALLDGLGSSMPLDLCAYLHHGVDERPRLHLRSPAFASLEPSDGFELCDLLGTRLRAGESGGFRAAGFVGVTVPTAGADAGRGLFAVGRRTGALGAPEIAAVEAFCRTLGASVHQLAAGSADAAGMPPHTIDVTDATLGAEATVRLDLAQGPVLGHAWAGGRVEAVATALLKAVRCDRMFRYAAEVEQHGERRALVLLQGDDGTAALRGASVPAGSSASAVVVAAYRAAAALHAQP